MATELYTHPTAGQLRDFAQGRLSGVEMAEVERHVAQCDSCCKHLEQVPEDTLVQLARDAATQGVRTPAATRIEPAPKPSPGEIPQELRDHPRYRVLSLVGLGGMGAVYKAEHRKMERLVALKVINRSLLANPQAVERFSREVRAVSKLSHPNIVLVHDADDAGDLHFLVMEYVDGVSLDRVVAHNGQLSPAQAANFIAQAAKGLQHAHEKGMVHRDIKPQNLMMTRKKEIKILDFGLARLGADQPIDGAGQGSAAEKPGQTVAGMILGTPDYIAPEQATDARSADIRADIYSLGCTMYYLLTAEPPFPTGTTIEKLHLHLKSAPPPVLERRPDVPAELARILDKMLAKDPSQRYQTPDEVAKDLASFEASGRRKPPGNADAPAIPITPSAPAPAEAPSPFDDPALAFAASPLRPVVQPKPASQLPFGLTPPAAVGLGVGAVVLLGLLAWGIRAATSGSGSRDTIAQQQPAAASNSTPPAPPSSSNPPRPVSPTATNRVSPPVAIGSGQIGNNLPRKVLLVIPSRGFWEKDYEQLQPTFETLGVELTVASTSLQTPRHFNGSQASVVPDVVLDASLRGENFGAVIFAGYDTSEFHPDGTAGEHTSRLIREMLENGRIVASICVGQRVLDQHGLIENKKVAHCQYLEKDFPGSSGNKVNQNIVPDGQIITAGADTDGPALATAIESRLGR